MVAVRNLKSVTGDNMVTFKAEELIKIENEADILMTEVEDFVKRKCLEKDIDENLKFKFRLQRTDNGYDFDWFWMVL